MKSIKAEKEALQNWADNFGLEVKSFIDDDKRKTQRYFLRKGHLSISPSLTYKEMNCFLNGMYKCKKHNVCSIPNAPTTYSYRVGSIKIEADSINELRELSEQLEEMVKESGMDLPKHLNDACFSINADYQKHHDLNEDNWDLVH